MKAAEHIITCGAFDYRYCRGPGDCTMDLSSCELCGKGMSPTAALQEHMDRLVDAAARRTRSPRPRQDNPSLIVSSI